MRKNIILPPENYTLAQLIRHICDYGVGNLINKDGDPIPWTVPKLSHELSSGRGNGVTDVAIRSWIKEKEKAIPRTHQLHNIARVASGGDEYYLNLWTKALINARREAITEKNSENAVIRKKSSINNSKGSSQKSSAFEFVDETKAESAKQRVQKRNTLFILLIVSSLTILLSGGYYFLNPSISSKVEAMKFCDPENFSDENDICERSIVNFPSGTKMILVSFRIDGAEDGKKFERRWYRNGEKWKEMHDFYDDAWPGYTFIHNESGHDLGEYALRVIIDGITYTGRFTVGEIK